jgi:VCBS repeat-containing protein
VNEDAVLNIAAAGILANDTDVEGNSLTAVLVSGPSHGTLTLSANGSFTYTPAVNYFGIDSFAYQASDGSLNSRVATVAITVKAVNDAPTLDAISNPAAISEDAGPQTVNLSGITAGVGESQSLQVSARSSNTALVANPTVDYASAQSTGTLGCTPVANASGTAVITVTVRDAGLDGTLGNADDGTYSRSFTLTVSAVNDAPVASNDAYSVNEDAVLNIAAAGVLANDTDLEGNSLTAVLVSGPSHGTLSLSANGSFTYTPAASYFGIDSFAYKANDDALDSNVATVVVAIRERESAVIINKQFDFGTSLSPVESGFVPVNERTRYSTALGYGWTAGSVNSADRRNGTACDRDLNYSKSGTFAVDVPAGTYIVDLRVGDMGIYAHDLMGFSLEGVAVDTISTAARQVVEKSYIVKVADGQLTLKLYDLGGKDKYVAMTGLKLRTLQSQPAALTVNDALGAFAPSTGSSAAFDVVFSEPVKGSAVDDLMLGGVPAVSSVSLTGRGTTYQIVENGLKGRCTVTADSIAGSDNSTATAGLTLTLESAQPAVLCSGESETLPVILPMIASVSPMIPASRFEGTLLRGSIISVQDLSNPTVSKSGDMFAALGNHQSAAAHSAAPASPFRVGDRLFADWDCDRTQLVGDDLSLASNSCRYSRLWVSAVDELLADGA